MAKHFSKSPGGTPIAVPGGTGCKPHILRYLREPPESL
jgi:hypothetical protein